MPYHAPSPSLRDNLLMDSMRVKYLAMIQSVITRMAANQFTVRKWSVGLGTAIIGWAVSGEGETKRAIVAVLPAAAFWIMDGYYLDLERRFRALFDAERVKNDAPAFSLVPPSGDWLGTMFRPAVWLVHGPILALAIGIGGPGWLH